VKRVALLGATGSIGRQAIEIVEAHPELELCAVASGSTPLDDIDAPLKQVGGDLTELLDRAAPDVVLNAVVGFAGIHATLWALEHGGEPRRGRRACTRGEGAGRRPDPAGRQRALRALPVPGRS
jgi:1-deoxy-D-xylulose 5-phosphate reductoisomerase